ADVVAIDGVPLMPLHAGELRKKLLDLPAERRRRDRLCQEPQAGAVRLRGGEHRLQRSDELAPCRGVAELAYDLGTIGIVQTEDGRLHERVARAERGRMIRIAFDLRRMKLMRLDEHTGRI